MVLIGLNPAGLEPRNYIANPSFTKSAALWRQPVTNEFAGASSFLTKKFVSAGRFGQNGNIRSF
jgi:hypothetical protein